MSDSSIATAADYADAMMTARRAKNVLVLLILLILLIQMTVFFLVRFDVISISSASTTTTTVTLPATSQPVSATVNWADLYQYVLTISTFLGVVLPIVLGMALLLIVNIMLVGRLIGVARVTSAYIWLLVLLVLLFPWQAFWGQADFTAAHPTWKLPGVLYTWYEFSHPALGAKFSSDPFFPNAFLKWARYAGFPFLAVIILLGIQIKSNRGMKQALGEDDLMMPGESAV